MTDWLPEHTADTWRWHTDGIELVISQPAPTRRGLDAWVVLHWRGTTPTPGLLLASRLDLMGSRSAATIAGCIDERHREQTDVADADWRPLIQRALYDVITHHMDGPEPVRLADIEPAKATFVLRPLIGAVGASAIVGAGQSGKSMLGLAAAAAVASGTNDWIDMHVMAPGPVIFCDWEADADTHAARLQALAAGCNQPPPNDLHYVAADAPLSMWAPALRRRVADLDATLVVIDSVMLARGGEAAAADTIAFYAALRTLGVPALLIDHQSRGAIREGESGSFGSVINDNSARLRWVVRGDQTAITLRQAKANNFGRLPTIGLSLDVRTSGDTLTSARWRHVDATPRGTTAQRIEHVLADNPGGMRPSDIASHLDANIGTVRKELRRLADTGRLLDLDGTYYPPEADPRPIPFSP